MFVYAHEELIHILTWALEVSLVLNVGTIHQGTIFHNFPIFAPYMFFLAFSLQNWNLQS
jgi:hypothetical protein